MRLTRYSQDFDFRDAITWDGSAGYSTTTKQAYTNSEAQEAIKFFSQPSFNIRWEGLWVQQLLASVFFRHWLCEEHIDLIESIKATIDAKISKSIKDMCCKEWDNLSEVELQNGDIIRVVGRNKECYKGGDFTLDKQTWPTGKCRKYKASLTHKSTHLTTAKSKPVLT